jgi:Ca2+/Na+ antiporter
VLKIFHDIYLHFIIKTALLFVALFLSIYLLSLSGIFGKTAFWIIVAGLFIVTFLIIVMMIYKLHKRLNEDIETLREYLKKIDAKEYDAEIKIKNYLEFLEFSLLLKNLLKRLYQKEKKASKK